MSLAALSSARKSVFRKLMSLNFIAGYVGYEFEALSNLLNPADILLLCDELDKRSSALITGIALLRHEAKAVIEARKGDAA